MTALAPSELRAFIIAVSQRLDAEGLPTAGDLLRDRALATYTAGSEWLGEVGSAMREIAEQYRLPEAVIPDMERIILSAGAQNQPPMGA